MHLLFVSTLRIDLVHHGLIQIAYLWRGRMQHVIGTAPVLIIRIDAFHQDHAFLTGELLHLPQRWDYLDTLNSALQLQFCRCLRPNGFRVNGLKCSIFLGSRLTSLRFWLRGRFDISCLGFLWQLDRFLEVSYNLIIANGDVLYISLINLFDEQAVRKLNHWLCFW